MASAVSPSPSVIKGIDRADFFYYFTFNPIFERPTMPYHKIDRRSFIRASGSLPLGAAAAFAGTGRLPAQTFSTEKPPRARLSCNLYSFNGPLRSGQMTLDGVIELCADLGFDAVDPSYTPPTLAAGKVAVWRPT